MTNEEVIKKVLITEKGSILSTQNRYILEVAVDARKPQIADAVEKKFGVLLAVLAPRVVLAADAGHHIQEVNVAAAVGVAVALAVWAGRA